MVSPAQRREAVRWAQTAYQVSERRACRALGVERTGIRYRPRTAPDAALRQPLRELAQARPAFGHKRLHVLLRRDGLQVNHKKTHRLYKEEGLTLKRMKPAGKRKAARQREEKLKSTAPDQAWSMDFVSDQLQDGTRFRSLTIVDVFTREAVAIDAGQSLKGEDVVRTLSRLKSSRGVPKVLFCDNGSEFTSQVMDLWAYRNGVKIDFSRLGKPTDNAFVESFNGTFRSECLNIHWFMDLKEATHLIEAWRHEYNESRPHASLADRTPSEFASQYAASRVLAET